MGGPHHVVYHQPGSQLQDGSDFQQRDKLKAEGKPVPENLKAGALKAVEDKAAAAKVAASMAVQNAKGAPESKLGEGQLEERSSVDEAVAAADAAIQDALEAMRA